VSYYAHAFTAPLVLHRLGRYRYRVVFLPAELEARLPFDRHPRLRIDGEIADVPVQAAWQSAGAKGGHYLMVSPAVCRAAGLALGDTVEVRFNVADADAVTVPEELADALDADPAARLAWESLTPGRRRGLAYPVASARTEATRRRRAAALIAALLAGSSQARRPGAPAAPVPRPPEDARTTAAD
jgi:hypothetical protein